MKEQYFRFSAAIRIGSGKVWVGEGRFKNMLEADTAVQNWCALLRIFLNPDIGIIYIRKYEKENNHPDSKRARKPKRRNILAHVPANAHARTVLPR